MATDIIQILLLNLNAIWHGKNTKIYLDLETQYNAESIKVNSAMVLEQIIVNQNYVTQFIDILIMNNLINNSIVDSDRCVDISDVFY